MIKKCKQNSEKAIWIKNRMKIEQSRIKLRKTLDNKKESGFIRVGSSVWPIMSASMELSPTTIVKLSTTLA